MLPAEAGLDADEELLDASRLKPLALDSFVAGAGTAPGNAVFDASNNTWKIREDFRMLLIPGMISLVFAALWLWKTMPVLSINNVDFSSIVSGGFLLFRAAFVLVGALVAALGVALIFLSSTFRFSAREIRHDVRVLGWSIRPAALDPSEVLALRVIQQQDAGKKLALGIVSKRGVMVLPIEMSTEELNAQPDRFRQRALAGRCYWASGNPVRRQPLQRIFSTSIQVSARPCFNQCRQRCAGRCDGGDVATKVFSQYLVVCCAVRLWRVRADRSEQFLFRAASGARRRNWGGGHRRYFYKDPR